MDKSQEAFFKELLADFKVESAEHKQVITNSLLMLEKNPEPSVYQQYIETTFREFHNLKGAARAVTQPDIERLCQVCEGVFHQVKLGKAILTPPMFDLLHKIIDMLGLMLTELELKIKTVRLGMLNSLIKAIEVTLSQSMVQSTDTKVDLPLVESEELLTPEEYPEPVPAIQVSQIIQGVEKSPAVETVRVSTTRLNNLLRQSEEFISAKAVLTHYIEEIKKVHHPELQYLEWGMVGFNASFSRMVDELIYEVKSAMMFPFSSYLDILPKIVRDLSKEYNKEIDLNIVGADILIDRHILEGIKDPLVHIIRNCIDHGIEIPAVRLKAGKSSRGHINIDIKQDSGRQVELCIRDDGAGISAKKVADSAIRYGIITKEAAASMNSKALQSLIFKSGLSTSSLITDISGRGLGMAIAAEKITALGGNISLESTENMGTTFTIHLPLNLSTFRGIIIRINNQQFVIPTGSVEKVLNVRINELKTVRSVPIISLNNEQISLVHLSAALGIAEQGVRSADHEKRPLLIINHMGRKSGFLVDEVRGELEGVVKSLGPQLRHLKNFAGATIAGDGSVIPIIDVAGLMDTSARLQEKSAEFKSAEEQRPEEPVVKTIQIAEDSITSRTLIRNILESAGYLVRAAVDGAEAYKMMLNEPADLVVSDIEMPHMNGFELTIKLRAEERFRDLPIILVTALSSDTDRQRGLEAGASAYIVKGNFEQSNLLETINRLL